MAKDREQLPANSTPHEVDGFLRKMASMPVLRPAGRRGRLIFGLDATASREPTWDRACHIQGQMFAEAALLGGIEIRLIWYRGFGECRAGRWTADSGELLRAMTAVRCRGGHTQIRKILGDAIREAGRGRVDALVFVGDCVEEDVDELCHLAGQLGVLGVPVFVFHEGHEPVAARAFAEIARLTGGACCRFDADSPGQLRDLLSAVAVYAAGGRAALEDFGARAGGLVPRLTSQIR